MAPRSKDTICVVVKALGDDESKNGELVRAAVEVSRVGFLPCILDVNYAVGCIRGVPRGSTTMFDDIEEASVLRMYRGIRSKKMSVGRTDTFKLVPKETK